MRIKTNQNLSNIKTLEEFIRYASETVGSILTEFNGRISFQENLQTQTVSLSFSTGGQEIGLGHNLGFIPNGYIPISNSTGVVLYDGSTPNTKDTIYLRATGAGSFTVLIF